MEICHRLSRRGIKIVGVPKTIDNDVACTDSTFGFDTAVRVATEALDALHSTADAHRRVILVEVMGRTAGWIALYAGVASGADLILMPELRFTPEGIASFIRRRHVYRRFTIGVVAEGAGRASEIGTRIEQDTGIESRVTVLGHLQRGGTPSPTDRVLATRLGAAAVDLVVKGRWNRMVAIRRERITDVALARVAGHVKRVPKNHELIAVARSVGTSFGEPA